MLNTDFQRRCNRYDDDDIRRRYEDENEIPLQRYRSPGRRSKPSGRDEPLGKIVPFEKNKKSKYEMIENEKKMSSNALAKEFKRRSYEKADMDKRYSEREYDGYPDEMDKAEIQRRNQYNLTDMEFKRNSHELAREFNKRSRSVANLEMYIRCRCILVLDFIFSAWFL